VLISQRIAKVDDSVQAAGERRHGDPVFDPAGWAPEKKTRSMKILDGSVVCTDRYYMGSGEIVNPSSPISHKVRFHYPLGVLAMVNQFAKFRTDRYSRDPVFVPSSHAMPATASIKKSDKKLAVLNAAAAVFLAHGFSAASTDMIQSKAGVSKATMYACFPNKEAMFMAVIERECAAMAEMFRSIRTTPGDLSRMLSELGGAYLGFVLTPTMQALYRVVVAEAPRIPNLGRRFYLAGPQVAISVVAERLSEVARAGEIDVQSVGLEAAAALFLGMVRAEAQLECLTHPDARPSALQVDRWVQIAVTTFLRAFGIDAAAAARNAHSPH
jgi:AcrR family transcriptional regulator